MLTSNVSVSFRRYCCCGSDYSNIGAVAGIDGVCGTLEDVSIAIPRGVSMAFKLFSNDTTNHCTTKNPQQYSDSDSFILTK